MDEVRSTTISYGYKFENKIKNESIFVEYKLIRTDSDHIFFVFRTDASENSNWQYAYEMFKENKKKQTVARHIVLQVLRNRLEEIFRNKIKENYETLDQMNPNNWDESDFDGFGEETGDEDEDAFDGFEDDSHEEKIYELYSRSVSKVNQINEEYNTNIIKNIISTIETSEDFVKNEIEGYEVLLDDIKRNSYSVIHEIVNNNKNSFVRNIVSQEVAGFEKWVDMFNIHIDSLKNTYFGLIPDDPKDLYTVNFDKFEVVIEYNQYIPEGLQALHYMIQWMKNNTSSDLRGLIIAEAIVLRRIYYYLEGSQYYFKIGEEPRLDLDESFDFLNFSSADKIIEFWFRIEEANKEESKIKNYCAISYSAMSVLEIDEDTAIMGLVPKSKDAWVISYISRFYSDLTSVNEKHIAQIKNRSTSYLNNILAGSYIINY